MSNQMLATVILSDTERQVLGGLKSDLERYFGSRLRKAVLFGSKARGDAVPESDIDVAIVINGLDRDSKREIFDHVADLEIKYLQAVSLLAFSTEQFDDLLRRERRIALDIEVEGIPL